MRTFLAVGFMGALGVACGGVSSAVDAAGQPDTAAQPPDATPEWDAPVPDAALPDGPPADAAPPRCDLATPFGPAILLTELNSSDDDLTPSLTADELEILFASNRPGGQGGYDIYVATRASAGDLFDAPSLLSGVNSTRHDMRPIVAADELSLYAAVYNGSNWDILVATRPDPTVAFGVPVLEPALNGASGNDQSPFLLPDRSAIYFMTNRDGNPNIYRAPGMGTTFGLPVPATGTSLVTGSIEDYPTLTPDELTLYFASNRGGGAGNIDIWMATRASLAVGFSAPVNVAELNTSDEETPGWISPDGCVLYFHRHVAPNGEQLFMTTRGL